MRDEDNEKPISAGRRRLLGTLAAGGAAAVLLPEKWTRPVIDRILVPAHAQQVSRVTVLYFTNREQLGQSQSGNLFERIADVLIPPAHAIPANSCVAEWPMGVAVYRENNSAFFCVTGCGGGWGNVSGMEIDPIKVECCGEETFGLTNAEIINNMTQLAGTLYASQADCYGGSIVLNLDTSLPVGCGICAPT